MIKSIVFDMGQVMLRFDPDSFLAREGISDAAERAYLRPIIFNRPEWGFMDWGYLDEKQYLERYVLPELDEKYHALATRLVMAWDDPIMPMEGMAELVRSLKERGYSIYLLSNASSRLHDYFPRCPGSEYFDGIVVSADIKIVKPQPEIYHHLLEKFSIKAEETVFIDDNLMNITAALRENIHGFMFRSDVPALRAWLERELER
ncbi:MAG: HAD family phosphatase [Spirochaetales bacterium]|nr:HAD family phosphatase [Spirochaetales bacterium]